MKETYTTILVVPCYNEEYRINQDAYFDFLSNHPEYLLIFVDDGSTDNTKEVLGKVISRTTNLVVLTYTRNMGKAGAVRHGILHALENYEARYIGFIDADLSTPLTEFPAFEKYICPDKGISMVLGSRVQMLGRTIDRNIVRHWISRVIATIICKVLDEPVYDTQCGAKLFSWKIAGKLFEEPFLSKWLFDVEVLARHKIIYGAGNFRSSVVEVPLHRWTEKENSKLHYSHIGRILIDLYKINKRYF